MAAVATWTLLKAFPNRLKYQVDTSGVGDTTVNRTRAQMLTDCVAGPLKDAITVASSGAAFAALLSVASDPTSAGAGLVQVTINSAGATAVSTLFGVDFVTTDMTAYVTNSPAGTVSAFIDVVHIHSIPR